MKTDAYIVIYFIYLCKKGFENKERVGYNKMVQAVFANKGELHMNIKLQNTAKIIEADIGLDGISVISGLNNTGKSTILKRLSAHSRYFSDELADKV